MSNAIKKLEKDDDGQPTQLTCPHKCIAKDVGTVNQYGTLDIRETSDAKDSDFSDEMPCLQSGSDSDSDLDSDKDQQMTNEEVF